MFTQHAISLVAISALASACAPELYKRDGHHPAHIHKRQHGASEGGPNRGWTFDHPEQWNSQHEAWGTCFSGTQQSPIAFTAAHGLAKSSPPTFNYPDTLNGTLNNWDFGPQFILDKIADDNTTSASIHFTHDGKNETAYFRSWHTHSPSEHISEGHQARAELHFVHYDTKSKPRAVVSFLIDRHTHTTPPSPFFQQLEHLSLPTIFDNRTLPSVTINLNLAVRQVGHYKNFRTYKGSLTAPPCTEGLRWFVAKDVLYVSDEQMRGLLSVSTFGARPTNRVWGHDVNK